MNPRRLIIIALVGLGVVGFFWFDLGRYLSLDAVQARRMAFEALYARMPVLVSLAYFVIYVLAAALALPVAAVLTLAGGALFGLGWGLVLVSFASTIGATLAFLAARIVFGEALQERFAQQLKSFNAGVEKEGPFYLFALRLVPLPFFVINAVMGLTRMPVVTFYWVSQLGMLPGTVVFVYAGTQLAEIRSLSGIVEPELLGAFALLAVFPLLARAAVGQLRRRRVYAGFRRPPRFDNNLLVIGAGSAGLISALIAATVKARVTLVERHRMGGDCLNTGCVPSKALIRSASVAHLVSDAARFGVRARAEGVDFTAVMERVRGAIATIEPNDSVERYTELGVQCIAGDARLIDPWTVEVNGQRITSRAMVLATGARPLVPPLPGLAACEPLTSDTVWDLRALPRRLLVMGGGPIGAELAQSFARLGSQVTLVDMLERILPREDPDVSAAVLERFVAEGIDVRLGHRATAFEIRDGVRVMRAERAGESLEIEFDEVLVAVGRRPNTEDLGLAEVGVECTPAGTLAVDEYLRTTVPNILACGDVVGPWQFTHMASHQAWYAAVNGLFGFARSFRANYAVVPWATYTDPEVARVGLNETDAAEQGIAVEVTRYDLGDLDRAIAESENRGFIKVLTPPDSDRILGATIVGPHGGDLIAQYVMAMTHGLGLGKIMATIHVYPTWSEAVKFSASAWRRKHVPEKALAWAARLHDFLRG